jgi:hypothetical protein
LWKTVFGFPRPLLPDFSDALRAIDFRIGYSSSMMPPVAVANGASPSASPCADGRAPPASNQSARSGADGGSSANTSCSMPPLRIHTLARNQRQAQNEQANDEKH